MTTRPASVNFRWYPHATFTEQVTLRDSTGALVNLTGYTALAHIRRERDDPDPLFVLSTTTGGIVLGGAAGTVSLLVSATDTDNVALLDPDGEAWVYDMLLTSGSGTVERTLQGWIFVFPPVTRPA